jgi:translation initiation factor 2 subunit 2
MVSIVNKHRKTKCGKFAYLIPSLETRNEGINTFILNLHAVSRALGKRAIYLCVYLGGELGTQTQMSEDDKLCIVNGEFKDQQFQELLDGFIKTFVLCVKCNCPETELSIDSKNLLHSMCYTCGNESQIEHEFVSFIIKNPDIKRGRGGCKCAATCPMCVFAENHHRYSAIAEHALATTPFPNIGYKIRPNSFEKYPKEFEKYVIILIHKLWGEAKPPDVLDAMKEHKDVFLELFRDKPQAQLHALRSIETMIQNDSTKLEYACHYFKEMCELELIDDNVFEYWLLHNGTNIDAVLAGEIRKKVDTFFVWLRDVEEESTDDEQDPIIHDEDDFETG